MEWPFIVKSLQYFGFAQTIVNQVKCFYSNIESCFLNNSWTSNFFTTERGVRQRCPLSPYLFGLSVEVLAKVFKQKTKKKNRSIKGIFVDQDEIKISQYADDITFIASLSRLLSTHEFGEVSGLKLNSKKTEAQALWIGTNSGKNEILLPDRNFRWQNSKVRSLGVWFATDPETTVVLNYKEKQEKVRNILSYWKYHRLTGFSGKIPVLKSSVLLNLPKF